MVTQYSLANETAIVPPMADKKQKRLSIHWSKAWDEEMVRQAKQAAVARDLSLSAFVAEAVREKLRREKLTREGALPDKLKKK